MPQISSFHIDPWSKNASEYSAGCLKAILQGNIIISAPTTTGSSETKKDEKKNYPHKLLTAFIGLACDYDNTMSAQFIHLFLKCLI